MQDFFSPTLAITFYFGLELVEIQQARTFDNVALLLAQNNAAAWRAQGAHFRAVVTMRQVRKEVK